MVGVAQLVRALGCGPRGCGFKSRLSPHFFTIEDCAPVAQLDRATDSGSVGQRFEPSLAHHGLDLAVFDKTSVLFETGIGFVG